MPTMISSETSPPAFLIFFATTLRVFFVTCSCSVSPVVRLQTQNSSPMGSAWMPLPLQHGQTKRKRVERSRSRAGLPDLVIVTPNLGITKPGLSRLSQIWRDYPFPDTCDLRYHVKDSSLFEGTSSLTCAGVSLMKHRSTRRSVAVQQLLCTESRRSSPSM